MDPTVLARWQFASLTVYHFLIVPLSIGMTLAVAQMQTLAYRRRGTVAGLTWDRASRFYGRIMLALFALGIVTGLVQEFQFGMNWSAYSRFVGDIFGAPLAMEGLVAFFLESTFLGLWIFGRDLLSPRVHLATIWLAGVGTVASAYFILAANSFMQHPVGLVYDAGRNRVELTSIWKVLTNSTQLVTFPHTILAAVLTAACLLLSVSAWHLRRSGAATDDLHRRVAALALGVILVSAVGTSLVGHLQGQVMTRQQPMKMAAAEALWDGRSHASFSLFAYADVEQGHNKVDIAIPDGLSLLATNSLGGHVAGINDVQASEVAAYGPGSYIPVVWLAYWCFRLMMGFGILAGLLAAALVLQWWRGRLHGSPWLLRAATWAVALPLLGNSFGWLFTETARQPWLVYGLLRTRDGVSTNVGSGAVLTSLVGFTALYGVLGVICFRLVRRIAQTGPDPVLPPPAPAADDSQLTLVWGQELPVQAFWFGAIATLWAGFFLLEGFDLGVGMLLPLVGRTEDERQVALRTIGPVWDGNEVWLIVAGAAMFAAFPDWYATVFSGFYLAFALLLVGLIVRGIGIEYRGKALTAYGRRWCEAGVVVGSLLAALLLGVAFADFLRGVLLDPAHDMTGGFWDLVTPYGLLGGLVTVSLFALHGSTFLSLRTVGEVHDRARGLSRLLGPVAAALALVLVLWTSQVRGGPVSLVLAVALVLALVTATSAARSGREVAAFAATGLAAALVPVWTFAALWPDVLPARNDDALSLTVHNASSTPYTLKVMAAVTVVFLPLVLAYQVWAYWVFRARVTGAARPETGGVVDRIVAGARTSAAQTLGPPPQREP